MAKGVLWVGGNDWSLREFHSMHSPIGTSYNSYLVQGSEPLLVDAVKKTLASGWIENLKTLFGPKLTGLKHILIQHAEPDHTSALPVLLKHYPHITLLASNKCVKTLQRFYEGSGWKVKATQGAFEVGGRQFVNAAVPMAHWPESSATYIPDLKLLFSNDAFGQHIASVHRFVDQVDPAVWEAQAKAYFANILLRLQKPVLAALKTASSLPGIDIILPSHGVGYRTPETIGKAIDCYVKWTNQVPSKKVVVLYDENWFGTGSMAEGIASGVGKVPGVEARVLHARRTHITDSITELVDAAAIAVGSAALHEGILPDLAQHLYYAKCLFIREKVGAIFGTYGWTKDCVPKEVRSLLFTPTKVKEVEEPFMVQWSPQPADLDHCEEIGKKLAWKALEVAK